MATTSQPAATMRIDGLPKLGWKTHTPSTFVGSLETMLSVTEHPVSVRDLQGLTGLAFRVRWLYYTDTPKWCPSCPVGECPEEIAAVGRNTGWQLTDTMDGLAPAWQAKIADSIARGVPAMVYDGGWNPAVAYGAAEGGRWLLVNDYGGHDEMRDVTTIPPMGLVVEEYTGATDPQTAAADALRMAVANWRTEHKHNGAADYWYGRAAYDHWIFDVLNHWDATDGSPGFPTCWNLWVIEDARKHAAEWLESVAPLFEDEQSAHLLAAAKIYRDEYAMLYQATEVEDAFNGDPEKWKKPDYRQRMAEVLTAARDAEEQAIREIEAAGI